MHETAKRLREALHPDDWIIAAATLRFVASSWAVDPDSFGDNEKDYRNTLRDIAQDVEIRLDN